MIRRYVLPIAVPLVVFGGYLFLGSAGGIVEDAWDSVIGPFLITYWIGLGFTIAWDVLTQSMHVEGASPTVVAVTGVLSAIVIFMMLGGIGALIDDPWLFGVAIAPGMRLAGPWLSSKAASH